MARVAQLKKFYAAAGLESLRRAERGVAFYHTRWRFTPHWWFYQAWRFVAWTQFVGECRARRLLTRVRSIPYLRLGEAVETWLADMEFNLAPDADAYRNPDPLVEEAIACIEAVARVPQQEHKWGVAAVAFSWPGLSQFYAGTVLPAVMAAAGGVQETDYTNKIQKIIIAWRRQITPRPGYFPPREATARK
jgi:hypothetical protein